MLNLKEKIAYEKGYRVDKEGKVTSMSGYTLKLCFDSSGYHIFSVRNYDGKSLNCRVHRLQAYQKFGDIVFEDHIVVRHLNGISTDNSYDNIAVGTHKDNTNDIPKEKRLSIAMHATSFVRKYNRDEVIKKHEELGRSYKSTMEYFGITSKGTLHFILNN